MAYIAFVIDAYARQIIGWRAARRMNTALVLDALEQAVFTRAQQGLDQGCCGPDAAECETDDPDG